MNAPADPRAEVSPPPVLRHPVGPVATDRLMTLTDGVFSIAMTLLVFDLQLPDPALAEGVAPALGRLWPNFLAFSVSFALLGIYWFAHRAQFHFVRGADHVLHWINLVFLAQVSLVPFTSRLLGRFPQDRAALAVYGVLLITIGLNLAWLWRYATRGRHLVDAHLPPAMIRYGMLRCLVPPAAYTVALACLAWDVRITTAVYAAVPLLYIAPGSNGLWNRWAGMHHAGHELP